MRDFEDQLDHPRLREFYTYWQSKRHGNKLPARRDIDPIEVPRLLPTLVLIDVVRESGGPRFRYRLIGSEVVDKHRENFTGQWIDEAIGPEAGARVIDNMKRVVETGEPHIWSSKMAMEGREHVAFTRLICPLADDGEAVDTLAGVYVFENLYA